MNSIILLLFLFIYLSIKRSTSATARKDSWFGQSTNQLWYMHPYCIPSDINVVLCKGEKYYYYGRNHCDNTHEAGVSCVSTNTGEIYERFRTMKKE